MRQAGLAGVSRRKGPRTTRRNAQARPAQDWVEREFHADAPDRLWVADITDVPTLAGFLSLAIVLDVFSRRIPAFAGTGWAMAGHLRTELVLDALDRAVEQRRPDSVIHHSASGDALASRRGASHPDPSCAHSKWTFRLGMGVVVRRLPARNQRTGQRGAVSLQTGCLMDQFQSCTRGRRHDLVREPDA